MSQSAASAPTAAQAAQGSEVFAQHCAICHGDVGQGLAIWRFSWDELHQNCSTAKCHGRAHPPEGFYMPNLAPALIGENTLTHFQTARELYGFMSKAMPYNLPGSLSSNDYWLLTAFLLREHHVPPGDTELNATNADSVPVNPVVP